MYLSNSAKLQQYGRPERKLSGIYVVFGNIEVALSPLLNVTPILLNLDSSLLMSRSGNNRADTHTLKSAKRQMRGLAEARDHARQVTTVRRIAVQPYDLLQPHALNRLLASLNRIGRDNNSC